MWNGSSCVKLFNLLPMLRYFLLTVHWHRNRQPSVTLLRNLVVRSRLHYISATKSCGITCSHWAVSVDSWHDNFAHILRWSTCIMFIKGVRQQDCSRNVCSHETTAGSITNCRRPLGWAPKVHSFGTSTSGRELSQQQSMRLASAPWVHVSLRESTHSFSCSVILSLS